MSAPYPIDPVPSGPVHGRPRGFVEHSDRHAALLAELEAAGVELGAYDHRIADWLAGWEWATVATIASWVKRAAEGGEAS